MEMFALLTTVQMQYNEGHLMVFLIVRHLLANDLLTKTQVQQLEWRTDIFIEFCNQNFKLCLLLNLTASIY